MSTSSLWVMDKNFNGSEILEFGNSWLFSPIIWGILSDKYIRGLIETPFGYKKSLISDGSLFNPLNNKVNNCQNTPDRVCWELSNQQVFFTNDKQIIAASIRRFAAQNVEFNKHTDGEYPLKQQHIIEIFNEIADEILKLDENEYPYFIWKNTSCDDGVENWFGSYNKNTEEYEDADLSKQEKLVTEFVVFENDKIIKFISNLDYFSKLSI